MKKDIPVRKVIDVAVAIIPKDKELWEVYLLNLKKDAIQNVLINSKGYGEVDGKKVQTTALRYFYETVAAESAIKVEPIQTKLFDIANEYWVSFQYDNFMFDKKYVFVRGSISEHYFTTIPILEQKGIMIK